MPKAQSVDEYLWPEDIKALRTVAMVQKVYIIVRRSNPEAKNYIGKPDYMAKPIDCKPKTADKNVGNAECAGLVINPELLPGAFETEDKQEKAFAIWQKFVDEHKPAPCEQRDGKEVRVWGPPGGKPGWAVQVCPSSKHYGCLLYAHTPWAINGKYVYGDLDLFGIAPAADPKQVLRVHETLLGATHARGPNTQSVQFSVNAMAGNALIKHGEQELFAEFEDEALDAFCPDGSIQPLPDAAAARHFYRTTLQGRQIFTDVNPEKDFPAWGRWRSSTAG